MLKEFLDWVQDHDDVYFITNEQLLAWMQEPKAISDLDSLDFLQCDMPDVSDDICNGMSPNQEGLLIQCSYEALNWGASSCYGCPNKQPTVEDPTPDQDTSEGRQERQALPQDCGTAWWDPVKGECLCQGT